MFTAQSEIKYPGTESSRIVLKLKKQISGDIFSQFFAREEAFDLVHPDWIVVGHMTSLKQ